PFYDRPEVVRLDPTEVSYTIQCFKDQQKMPTDAFDATLILKSIGGKYGVSPQGTILVPTPPNPQPRKAQ
ncbi:MAG: hypothetical protein QM666_04140, partial [Acinetobacter sp.]